MGDRAGEAILRPAPRARRLLATALDMIVAGVWIWARRSRSSDRAALAAEPSLSSRMLRPASELVREQLGSPGERLIGLRTVDRRSGRRVQLWRTLLLVATRAAGAELGTRARRRDPEQERERTAFHSELRAVHERHPDDPDARQTEIARLFERAPESMKLDLMRSVGPIVVLGLLSALLRRRLAPTVVIEARARRDHRP
jgi:hypothetical protein